MKAGASHQSLMNVQVLRGFAAILVLLVHIAGHESLPKSNFHYLQAANWFGFAGVDLFFVISGFIIATAHGRDFGRPGRWPGYLLRRFWRIMPPYWIWLLAVAIPFTFLYVPEIALSLLQSKKLKQAILLLPSDSFQEWVTQAWTLSYELAFYGIFGLFILLPKVLGKGLLIAWACAVVALSIIPHRPFAPWLDHLIGPFVCEFLLGILVARIAHSASRFHPAVYLSVGCVWLTASFLGTYFSVQSPIGIHPKLRVLVFGIPSMWLLLAAVVLEKRGYAIKTPLLQEMGNASYSLYLTHGTVLKIIYLLSAYTVFPQSPLTHIGWLMTMFLLSVAMGWGYYRWVERPLLKWGRRQFRRNEPQREFRGIASAITAAARPSA